MSSSTDPCLKIRTFLHPTAVNEYCRTVYKPLACNLSSCARLKFLRLAEALSSKYSSKRAAGPAIFRREIPVDSSRSPTESLEKEVESAVAGTNSATSCNHNCFFEDHLKLETSEHRQSEDNSGLDGLFQYLQQYSESCPFRIHPRLFIDHRGGLFQRKPMRLAAGNPESQIFVLRHQQLFSRLPAAADAQNPNSLFLLSPLMNSGTASQARKTQKRFHHISAVVSKKGTLTVMDLKKKKVLLAMPAAKYQDGVGRPFPGDSNPGGHLSTEDFWYGGKSVLVCFNWGRRSYSEAEPATSGGTGQACCESCGSSMHVKPQLRTCYVLGSDRPYSICNQRVSSSSTLVVFYPVSRSHKWLGLPCIRVRSILVFPHYPIVLLAGDTLSASPIENMISDREDPDSDDPYSGAAGFNTAGTLVCVQVDSLVSSTFPSSHKHKSNLKLLAKQQVNIKSAFGDMAMTYNAHKQFDIIDSGTIMLKQFMGGINGLVPGEKIAEKHYGVALITDFGQEGDASEEDLGMGTAQEFVLDLKSHPSKYPVAWLQSNYKSSQRQSLGFQSESVLPVRKRLFKKPISAANQQPTKPTRKAWLCCSCVLVGSDSAAKVGSFASTSGGKKQLGVRGMKRKHEPAGCVERVATDGEIEQLAHYDNRFVQSWAQSSSFSVATERTYLSGRILRELTDSRSSTLSNQDASPEVADSAVGRPVADK